jgi:hypothetical protein
VLPSLVTDARSPRALTEAQKRALYQDGFVLLPGVVPRPLIDEMLRAINHSLGSEGIDKQQLGTFRARTFTPGLLAGKPIRDIYIAVAPLVESAIGVGRVRVPVPSECQIALRFPSLSSSASLEPHIDGISPPDGERAGTLYHFTALAGVFLNDVPEPNRGNIILWPGSHHLMEQHLRTHGVQEVIGRYPNLPLSPPQPLRVRAGDALLAHYSLTHAVGPNFGPHVRYAVFFRLFHVDHAEADTGPLMDIWREWEGMRSVLPCSLEGWTPAPIEANTR